MRDIIFLFGAGASYGAGDILPEQPPLGFQLYGELARIYPGSWGALPEDIERALQENFETGMQEIYDRISPAIPQLMREMAIYFAQFRPATGRTLYCRLIEALEAERLLNRVVFSTLNYECILELSLLRKKLGINVFQSPSESDGIPVWKLHGSCNMFAAQIDATPGVLYSAGVTFEGGVEAIFDTNEVIGRWLTRTALAPVMCLYMRDKPLSVAPSVIKSVQSMWQTEVRASTAVVCVGVNAYAADTHIWAPIAEAPGQLYFIGAKNHFEKWRSTYRPTRSHFLGERFADAFTELTRRLSAYAA